jgi:hypothetical protein
MQSRTARTRRAGSLLATRLLLSACNPADVVERPAPEPSQAEKRVCEELARDFPTWAYDGEPETAANRIDTEVSVEEGLRYTDVFKAVCPGRLP